MTQPPLTATELSGSTDLPVYRQIYLRFRRAIEDGRLRPGERVPSVRALAAELNLARGTVESAYQLLIGEGYLQARGPAGTVVSQLLKPGSPKVASQPPPAPTLPRLHSGELPAPLQMGMPALDAFPRKLWNRLMGRELRDSGLLGLVYPDACGYRPLRSAIAGYLGISRGIRCSPEQVFICAGHAASLDLICRTLMSPGDQCWFEDPGYVMARHVLERAGAQLIAVPVDDDGLNVDAALQRAPDARFAVVTPSHQSPLGVSLSLARRQALLDWANRRDSWIIEDDYDSEYRYQGHPLPALKSIDSQGRVLYTGTFSKVLAPGLRLSYLVVPEHLIERFTTVADALHNHCPQLLQATVAAFIRDGHFARHLKKMRSLYARRRALLIEALERELGQHLQIDARAGGMHLLARLRTPLDDQAITRNARTLGYSVLALSAACQEVQGQSGLLLGFTNVTSADVATEWARGLAGAFDGV
ncbi:PLP-dependent aminotransferase family protein [Pseudomonas sp. NPDC090202]|uniref:MocR-like pyridoxine biosynthesis transcription factor PdxR n=1 Tax=unclassified Pseudomonas TaxID=196821 RepID=UPI0038159F12